MPRLPLLTPACCLLIGCASGPQPTVVATVQPPPPIQVPPPPNLTRPPLPLPDPPSGRMPDLESNHRDVARAYHQLAAQMCLLLQHLEIEHRECLPWLRDGAAP